MVESPSRDGVTLCGIGTHQGVDPKKQKAALVLKKESAHGGGDRLALRRGLMYGLTRAPSMILAILHLSALTPGEPCL